MPEAKLAHEGRIPSLDGLRALSITLVFLAHIAGTRHAYPTAVLDRFGDFGRLGVRVFFVISGYLITSLLLKELDRNGRVSLRQFYIRRMLRIFPAFYSFMAVTVLLSVLGVTHVTNGELLAAATFTVNFHELHWPTAHLWSLSVEEQYYILWPSIVALAGRRSRYLAAAFIVLTPVMIVMFSHLHLDLVAGWFGDLCTIACGCLLAFTRANLHNFRAYRDLIQSPFLLLIPVAAFASLAWEGRGAFLLRIGVDLLLCLFLDQAITVQTSLTRLLNWRPIVFAGTLSYSLYLWQQLFLNRHSDFVLTTFPINVLLAFLTALISYRFIERPFLNLRRKFEPLTKLESISSRASSAT